MRETSLVFRRAISPASLVEGVEGVAEGMFGRLFQYR